MFEIEQKYYIDDQTDLERRLRELGGQPQPAEEHADTYFNHPSRDFAATREAFRVRRVDGVPMITYKGPKLPGEVKARRELEWRLDPGDPDGSKMEELLLLLGFVRVATVRKQRRPFIIRGGTDEAITVVVDQVPRLGLFAEVELIASEASQIESARDRVAQLGQELGLRRSESRSYLRMILEKNGGSEPPLDS